MRWLDQCRAWVKKYDPVRPEHSAGMHHYAFLRMLSHKLPADAIITADTGGNVIMLGHAFQSKAGQRIFSSNGNTPMGFSMCAAIGAWFAQPARPIICIIGDGGFQLNLQELQTIKHYGVKVKIFIINNFILGNTAIYQLQNQKKPLACGPDGYSVPDFTKIARAYDLFSITISDAVEPASLIDMALALNEPVLCDVQHPYFCDYQPRMQLWDGGIEEAFPPLAPEEFAANMTVPPLEGWRERQKKYRPIPKEKK